MWTNPYCLIFIFILQYTYMLKLIDPLNNAVVLQRATLFGHIYRRHPEMRNRVDDIRATISDPDLIARSKKDGASLLYFRKLNKLFWIMVVGTPVNHQIQVKTSFLVFNTSKGDPIIWRKKIST